MNKENQKLKINFWLIGIIVAYLILGLLLIGKYRYVINPDGISYIRLAQKYLDGDFDHVVNGHWGPLISWLMVPFLYFCSDALLAAKIQSLFIGVVTLIAFQILLKRFRIPEFVRITLLACVIPVVLNLAYSVVTPDLLLAAMFLFYFSVVFRTDYAQRVRNGITCGFLGGLAYFAKSFALPFFLAHFFAINVFHYLKGGNKEAKQKILVNFLSGVVVFGLVSSLWIVPISKRYGRFTFGTAGKAALGWSVAPDSKGTTPVKWKGFIEPSNETAMSVWDDPSGLEVPFYSPLESWFCFKHQMKYFAGNLREVYKELMRFSPSSIVIGIGYIFFWLLGIRKKTIPIEIFGPTIAIILVVCSYSMVLIVDRYLWVVFLLFIIMGGYLLARLFELKSFPMVTKVILLVVFFAFLIVPATNELKKRANRGKWVYDFSKALSNVIKPQSRIAANTNWPFTLYLAYHLDCKYYGVQEKDISRAKLKNDLEKYNINYYFFWGDRPVDFSFLTNYREITGGRIRGLRIYGLKRYR